MRISHRGVHRAGRFSRRVADVKADLAREARRATWAAGPVVLDGFYTWPVRLFGDVPEGAFLAIAPPAGIATLPVSLELVSAEISAKEAGA